MCGGLVMANERGSRDVLSMGAFQKVAILF